MGPLWLPSRRNHVRSLWWPPALPAVATLLLLHKLDLMAALKKSLGSSDSKPAAKKAPAKKAAKSTDKKPAAKSPATTRKRA